MPRNLSEEIKFSRILQRYGGLKRLFSSAYFILAVILLIPTYSQWSKPGWWETVIAVIPNLLGFTIGAFALTLAFGDEKFRELLAKPIDDDGATPLKEMSATFLIFIIAQVTALIGAIVCKGMWEFKHSPIPPSMLKSVAISGLFLWSVSYLIFIYGILLALAAARWIHMLAVVFSAHANSSKQQGANNPNSNKSIKSKQEASN